MYSRSLLIQDKDTAKSVIEKLAIQLKTLGSKVISRECFFLFFKRKWYKFFFLRTGRYSTLEIRRPSSWPSHIAATRPTDRRKNFNPTFNSLHLRFRKQCVVFGNRWRTHPLGKIYCLYCQTAFRAFRFFWKLISPIKINLLNFYFQIDPLKNRGTRL